MTEQQAIFIEVEVDPGIASDGALARKLEEICPVSIFSGRDGRVEVVRENLDECVLCELCLEAAPAGKLAIRKLYDDTELRR
jgi:NAD-dependent dihydropyrimidine dehydrogenase PreA subunit